MDLPPVTRQLLDGRNFAAVSTLMADGSPHTTIVWVETDGKHVLFNIADDRVKTKNLRRDPRISIAIYDNAEPYRYSFIRGRVIEMTSEGAVAHMNRLAKKYLGIDEYPFFRPIETRLIVRVLPEKVQATDLAERTNAVKAR